MKRPWWLLLLVPALVWAVEKKVGTEAVRPTMQQLLLHMQSLRPFMVSEEKFQDQANEEKIKEHLDQLVTIIKGVKHDSIMKAPGLVISKKVLEEHLSETDRIFTVGNKSYARWALNSTFGICVSCHTQAPAASKNWDLVGFSDFGNDFDHAEFLFAARDFDRALALFDKVIDEYPDNKIKVSELEDAVERKVAIFARVKRDFKAGTVSMERSQKNKKLPQSLKKNLIAWEGLFRQESKMSIPDPKTAKDDDIRKFVAKEMKRGLWDSLIDASNPRLVTNLTVSGILYEYLNLNPSTQIKPEIYYWLALCDRALQNNFFFSLADLYLKECITQFPKSQIAESCYKEFEINTVLSYSGSGGINVPDEVKSELRGLRQLVYGNRQ
jgi:hypothetical protein